MGSSGHTPELGAILAAALAVGASDIHLAAGFPPTIRRRGSLEPLDGAVLDADAAGGLIAAMLTSEQARRFEREREMDFAYALPGGLRFRVNAFYQRGTPAAALRHIPATVAGLGTLGLPHVLADVTQLPRGLVAVTGPTGSGKSTTLAAMIDAINATRAVHIITIEDPIEFVHRARRSKVSQREVGADTTSFSRALRSALRQDPDIILVGELRDAETMATALTAAETGHLVFATLHTQDAPQTVDRIIDVFPPHQQPQIRVQLSMTLMAVCCQQLVPSRDGAQLLAACEVLIPTPAVRNLIREGKTHQIRSAIQTGAGFGMQTMEASLAALVRQGLVDPEAAARRCGDRDGLERLIAARTTTTGRQ